jgi:hypothetical protein
MYEKVTEVQFKRKTTKIVVFCFQTKQRAVVDLKQSVWIRSAIWFLLLNTLGD